MQWIPGQSDLSDNAQCQLMFFYGQDEPGTTAVTIGTRSEIAVERLLGCLMIGLMPREGLEEALSSLRDMLEFYNYKPAPHPPRLAAKAIDAVVIDKKKRPDLIIT